MCRNPCHRPVRPPGVNSRVVRQQHWWPPFITALLPSHHTPPPSSGGPLYGASSCVGRDAGARSPHCFRRVRRFDAGRRAPALVGDTLGGEARGHLVWSKWNWAEGVGMESKRGMEKGGEGKRAWRYTETLSPPPRRRRWGRLATRPLQSVHPTSRGSQRQTPLIPERPARDGVPDGSDPLPSAAATPAAGRRRRRSPSSPPSSSSSPSTHPELTPSRVFRWTGVYRSARHRRHDRRVITHVERRSRSLVPVAARRANDTSSARCPSVTRDVATEIMSRHDMG